jgi:cell division transport system permease protein
MALSYSFKTAIKSLCREKWINLLSIFTVASSLLIVTLMFFFLYNVELAANRLPEKFSMVAYLSSGLSENEVANIIGTLKQRGDITSVKYISKDEAMEEIKHALKDSASILQGLDENPLSASIELKIKEDLISTVSAKQVSEDIKKIPGIDDVYYGEKIAETISRLKRSIRNISIIIFLTISSGVVFVTYSTVKILFYRKKPEIAIIKLLGATKGFIRAPFLIEGGFIGFAGGIIGIFGALAFYFAITYRLSAVIPMLKSLVFPVEILISLPLTGIILGIIGSAIAIGRIKL